MAYKQSGINVINDDRSFVVVADTTANRNATPVAGMIRYNTSLTEYEYYNGLSWQPIVQLPSDAYGWGLNTDGQLGDRTRDARTSPVSVVGGFTDWVQVSAGGDIFNAHSAGIRANGTAWTWGSNDDGQLGDNTIVSKLSPVSVVGGFTDWVQISTAGQINGGHTVALRANRTAWGWGFNASGRLGDGTTTTRSSPVSVVGGFTDWVQINTGDQHTVALRANGTAWGWGLNTSGRLGDGTITSRLSPVSVVGGFTDWVQIDAGDTHTVAIRANGTAWGWGANGIGQLGTNTLVSTSSPVSVVGGFTDWVQISTGTGHTVAIRANGTAYAWGAGANGRLGDNTIVNKSSPVAVVGGFTDWVQVSAGGDHTAALRANGTAWGWGFNTSGRLGDGTTTSRLSPVSVVGGFTDWVQIDASTDHTLAIRR